MVTTVRVKKKNIEFQLGGGGYGVFGDDTGYVYVPEESKSRREKDLEKWIADERDYERRRRMQRELDDLRRDRERENRRARSESRELTAQKESEIASKRLDAGSRFNLWFEEYRLASRVPTPREMRLMLSQFVDFEDGPGGRPDMRPDMRTEARALPPPPAPRGDLARVSELRRGMSMSDVHDMLGDPTRNKAGKQGELTTITEWDQDGDRVTEVVYVGNVIVRFSTASNSASSQADRAARGAVSVSSSSSSTSAARPSASMPATTPSSTPRRRRACPAGAPAPATPPRRATRLRVERLLQLGAVHDIHVDVDVDRPIGAAGDGVVDRVDARDRRRRQQPGLARVEVPGVREHHVALGHRLEPDRAQQIQPPASGRASPAACRRRSR